MARELFKWATTRWTLSRCLLFARLLQASGMIASVAMNGFLLGYIHNNRLGYSKNMLYIEIMASLSFIYSSLVLLFQHSGAPQKRFGTPLIKTFVALDVVFNGVAIAILTMLAGAGLPANCHGLTRSNVEKDDAQNDPPEGYSTIRFGDGDKRGVLDKYCGLERSFYSIAAALIFTYMLTVTLGVVRIFEQRWDYASSDDVYHLRHILRSKIHSPNSSSDLENVADVAPPTEGVVTPIAKARASVHTQGLSSSREARRNRNQTFREQAQSQSLPVSPVSPAASPTSQVSPISPDMNHHRSFMNTAPGMLDTSMRGLMTSHSAEEAMITDGYRHQLHPRMQALAPYTPGQARGQFMDGHGDESNEMRLSEYVKGATRAQQMKDSGMSM